MPPADNLKFAKLPNRVCTHILAFEGDGVVYYYEGGFSDYEENRKQRQGEEVKKFRYKKLVAG